MSSDETMAAILQLQKQLSDAISNLQKEKEPVANKPERPKRPSARAKHPEKPKTPSLTKFFPVETSEDECVGSYHERDGNKVPAQSIKLCGKDELLIVWCPEHECAHYFLAQPVDEKRFEIFEIWRGATAPQKIKVTPAGDMDTGAALEMVEAWIEGEDDDEDDDEEDDDEED